MHPDVEALTAIAREVAGAVRAAPVDGFGRVVGMGADGTFTKAVDSLAEAIILKHAERRGWNVLSEEAGEVAYGGDRLLVVDPIDGTTNASRGIPLYCISLALGRRRLSDVDCGVVLNVATGDVYAGVRGRGATLNGERIRTRPYDPDDLLVAPTLGKYAGPKAIALARLPFNVRSFGAAALEMCFVASGGLDLYFYAPERMRVIDVAASTLIVREAGGRVLDAHGAELEMDLSLKPRTSVVAASGPEMLSAMEGVLT
ncbi:MAG TPA: inositol monophosphatase family protein [Candidatus Thermoplasmatota archaeon]|nr:inositol monophosphatase family protein [Candidatus Thermoplasmatota archaeon]